MIRQAMMDVARDADDGECRLWAEYGRTRAIGTRGQLEARYLHLVETLARQLARKLPGSVDVNDLIQEGFLGLRRAVERFEPDRGIKFRTYAQSAVWGAMMDSLRRDDFTTRSVRRTAAVMDQMRGELAQELGRPATDAEVGEALGLPEERIAAFSQWAEHGAMSTMSAGDDDRRMQLADDRAPNPFREAEHRDLRELLLRGYNPKERLLIILYYFEEMTMREIGATLGISESRVSQLHTLLVARIKADLHRKKISWQ